MPPSMILVLFIISLFGFIRNACGWILRVVAHICISESLCFPDIFLMNATAMAIFTTADSF